MEPNCWDSYISKTYLRTSTFDGANGQRLRRATEVQTRTFFSPPRRFIPLPPTEAARRFQLEADGSSAAAPPQPAPIASTRGTPRRRALRAAPRARAGIGQAGPGRAGPSRAEPRGCGPERPTGGTRPRGEPEPPARIPAERRGRRDGPQPAGERQELTEVVHGAGATARSPQRLATFPPRPPRVPVARALPAAPRVPAAALCRRERRERRGAARHAARGPRAPTSCWELQRATRRSLSSQCSGTEARRDAAPCLLRKPRQGVKELSPRCADGKRVRELEVKPVPITCSSQPSIHPSRSQRSRTSPGTPPQR